MKKYFFIILLTCFVLEFLLFQFEFKPGVLIYSNIDWEQDVQLLENVYENDESGIYKLDSKNIYASMKSIESLNDIIQGSRNLLTLIEQDNPSGTMPLVFKYYIENNEDSVIYDYLLNPINDEGFRSIRFSSQDSNKEKILLVGDSFVWGMSAEPIFKSFGDNLLANNYAVYNAGISGVDPAQYLQIVKKYLPELKPDFVLVNFFWGNDFMPFKRETVEEHPHEYYTSIGFLQNYPYGEFMEFEELVAFYRDIETIPQTTWFNKICSISRVGTELIWKNCIRLNLASHDTYSNYISAEQKSMLEKAAITKEYIEEMTKIAEAYNTKLYFLVIPEVPFTFDNNKPFSISRGQDKVLSFLFDNDYYFCKTLTKNDYSDNGHFNNQGSKKYTTFILDLLKEKQNAE